MADNVVNVKLKLTAEGVAAQQKAAKEIADNYERANRALSSQPGKRNAPAPKAGSSAINSSLPGETKTARSIGASGGTGSAASDFAAQASGLGGLVHVYATFAANLFAISAAFGALSKAMDVTNLVAGLDQIGASSGKNLGSIAKQMVLVADGALSLQQALRSTAMASTGGLTNTQMLRMTKVAQQASLALGRDLPDSMDRLTKGIIKSQPELLDELGIMTRMIPAQQAYAEKVGKTVSSLTTFEKQQAFANAVLEEGERKFSAIELHSNPYSKILSSIQNLMQSGLELVNKVLGPMVDMLSKSPTALAGVLGLVAATLLKQAVPALGMMKENAKIAAEQSKLLAVTKASEAQKGYKAEGLAIKAAAQANAQIEFNIAKQTADNIADEKVQALTTAEASIKKLALDTAKSSSSAAKILNKDLEDITKKDLTSLESTAKRLDAKAMTAYAKGNAVLGDSYIQAADKHRVYIGTIVDAQKANDNYAKEVVKAEAIQSEANAKALKASEDYARAELHKQGILDTGRHNQVLADRALSKAASDSIVSQAAQTASVKGFGAAWTEAYAAVKAAKASSSEETIRVPVLDNKGKQLIDAQGEAVTNLEKIVTPKMGIIRGGWTMLKVGITSATTAVGTFMNFIAPWLQIIGLAVGALKLLDAWLSDSAKQSEAYGSSLDTLNGSLDNVGRTIDVINKKNPLEQMSIESTQAKANALDDLTTSIGNVIDKFDKLKSAQNGWDQFWNGLFDMVGKGEGAKLAIALTDTVTASLKTMEEGPAKEAAKKSFSAILNTGDVSNPKKLLSAIKDLDESTISTMASNVANNLKLISSMMNTSAAGLTAFKTALVDINKQSVETSNKLIPTDDYSKMGMQMQKGAVTLNEALQDPINGLKALAELSKDTSTLSLIPTDTSKLLGSASKELDAMLVRLQELEKAKAIAADNLAKGAILEVPSSFYTAEELAQAKKPKQDALELANKTAEAALAAGNKSAVDLTNKFKNIGVEFANSAFTNLAKGFKVALMEASIIAAKGYLEIMKQAGMGTAKQEHSIAQAEFSIQREQINSQFEIVKSNAVLTVALDGLRLAEERLSLQNTYKEATLSGDTNLRSNASARLAINQTAIDDQKRKAALINSNGKDLAVDTKSGKMSDDTAFMFKTMPGFMSELMGKMAAMAKISAAAGAESILSSVKQKNEIIDQENITKNLKIDSLNIDKDALVTSQSMIGIYDTAIAKQLESLDLEKLKKQEEIDIANNKKIQNFLDVAPKGADKDKAQAALATKAVQDAKANAQAVANIKAATLKADIVGTEALRKLDSDRATLRIKEETDIKTAQLDAQLSDIKYLETIGAIEASNATMQTAALEKTKLEVALESQIASIKNNTQGGINTAEAAMNAANSSTSATDAQKAEAEAAYKSAEASQARQIALATMLNTEGKKRIELDAAHKSMLESQAETMAKMVSITENLTGAFGDLGTNIGKTGEALLKMVQDDDKYTKAKIDAEKKTAAARDNSKLDPEAYQEAIKAEKTLLDKKAESEVNNLVLVAGATKKMFNEKTAAYKIFSAVEKAGQVMSIAMTLKETATKIGAWATEVAAKGSSEAAKTGFTFAGFAARLPAYIGEIYASWGAMGPWMVGAAALFIASKLGIGGGGDSTPTFTANAEQAQKVQGTGQSYDSQGNLYDNGRGVFGDPTAKSKSIQNSLDILTANSIEGLSFSNKQVELLEKINLGIKNVAVASSGVQGIRSGSGFGTVESSTSNPGFLGLFASSEATSIINSGIKLAGTFKSLGISGEGLIQQFETVQTTSTDSGFFGIGASSETSVNTYLKPLEQKAATAIRETFQYMGDLLVVSGKKLNLSAEETLARANSLDIDIATSLKGLNGTESQDELNAIFSSILDDAYTKVAPQLKKFRQFGEGFAETVTRVIDGFDKVNLGLTSMGLDIIKFTEVPAKATDAMYAAQALAQSNLDAAKAAVPKIAYGQVVIGSNDGIDITAYGQINAAEITTANALVTAATKAYKESTDVVNEANAQMTTRGYELSDALIKAAGGLDKFLESAKLYADIFLTESERLTISKTAAASRLAEIGAPNMVANTTSGTMDNNGGLFGVGGELLPTLIDTNSVASSMFKTFSDGNDSIINTKKEYKTIIDAALESSKVVVAAEDAVGLARRQEAIDLYTHMTDPQLLQAQQAIWDAEQTFQNARYDQELIILGALGRTQEATNLQRAKELELMDARLRINQQALWVLEDSITAGNTAYATLSSSIDAEKTLLESTKTTSTTLISSIKSIFELLRTQISELYNEVSSTSAMAAVSAKQFIDLAIQTAANTGAMPDSTELSNAIKSIRDAANPSNFATSIEADQERLSLAAKLSTLKNLTGTQLTTEESLLENSTTQIIALDNILTNAKKQLDTAKGIDVSTLSVADAVAALDITLGKIRDNTKSLNYISDINQFINTHDWTDGGNKTASATALASLAKEKGWSYQMISEASGYDLDSIAKLFKDAGVSFQSPSSVGSTATGSSGGGFTTGPGSTTVAGPVSTSFGGGGSSSSETLAKPDPYVAGKGINYEGKPYYTVKTPLAYSDSSYSLLGTWYATDPATVAHLDKVASIVDANAGSLADIAEQGRLQGFTLQDVATAKGYSILDLEKDLAINNIPKFASGGDHMGGLRLVGENGPELEATGPSRIHNARQTQGLLKSLNNSDLIEEIRMLRKEVADLRLATEDSANSNKTTAKQLTRWDTEGVPVTSTTTDGIISVKTV